MSNPEATAEEELDALLREGKISAEDYDTLRHALAKGAGNVQARLAADRKLAKNWPQRQLGGVCAGIGEYFDIDPWRVRLAFLLAFLLTGGTALLVYLVLYIALPWSEDQQAPAATGESRRGSTRAFGISLLALWLFGIFFNLYLLPEFIALFEHLGGPLSETTLILMRVRTALWESYVALGLQVVFLALVYALYLLAPPGRLVRRALPRLLAIGVVVYVLLWAWGVTSALYSFPQFLG